MRINVIAVIDVEIDDNQAKGVEKDIIAMTADLASFKLFDQNNNLIKGKVTGIVPQEWQESD